MPVNRSQLRREEGQINLIAGRYDDAVIDLARAVHKSHFLLLHRCDAGLGFDAVPNEMRHQTRVAGWVGPALGCYKAPLLHATMHDACQRFANGAPNGPGHPRLFQPA